MYAYIYAYIHMYIDMYYILLWELLLLLQLLQQIAFKIPAHLGVVSFALKSSGSPALTLPATRFYSWLGRGLLSRIVICKFSL